MHRLIERKTFCKILLPIYESRTTSNDRIVDYAIKIAQDYDAELVILNIVRADANLHNVNVPNYVTSMKEQAQSDFVKITEKIHEGDNSNNGNILRIKTEISILSVAAVLDLGVPYLNSNVPFPMHDFKWVFRLHA